MKYIDKTDPTNHHEECPLSSKPVILDDDLSDCECPHAEEDSAEEKRIKDLEYQVAQLYRLFSDLTRSIQYYHREDIR